MNEIDEQRKQKLRRALETGASLREAQRYTDVSHGTALRWRLIWAIPANTQSRWKRRWIPKGEISGLV